MRDRPSSRSTTDAELGAAAHRPSRRADDVLLAVGRLGLAHSFFGQLYESVVDVPRRITHHPQSSLLAPNSPARYFVPAAPVTRAALVAGIVSGWRHPRRRIRLGVAAAAVIGETAITVHLVRHVNGRLFVADRQAEPDERPALLCRWHQLNGWRVAAEGLAWVALSGIPSHPTLD